MHVTDALFISSGNNYMHSITNNTNAMNNGRHATTTESRPRLVGTTVMSSGAVGHVSSNLDGRENMTLGQWKQTHGG